MTEYQESFYSTITMFVITSAVLMAVRYASVMGDCNFDNQSKIKNLFYQLRKPCGQSPFLNTPTTMLIISIVIPIWVWIYNWVKYFIHTI